MFNESVTLATPPRYPRSLRSTAMTAHRLQRRRLAMHRTIRAVALVCSLLAPPALAQGPAGTLAGRVLDASRAAVPGVLVTARHRTTGEVRTGVTTADGLYTLPALAVGRYDVTFELEGFRTVTRANVPVEAAVPVTLDVTLEVGAVAAQVTVVAEVPLLHPTTATVARQLGSAELTAVPSATRNFTHLLTATAGVSADLPAVAGNDAGSISPSVNGTRTTSNAVLLDGVDVTNLLSNAGSLDEGLVPAPETLQEVKLQTSLYDASTGRSGGGAFQLVTKSGGNTPSGSAYAFGQHEALNANDFFFEREGLTKPRMRRLESGLTLGGPIRRDRMFGFGSLQYSTAETGYVPTASSRALVPAALALVDGERTAEALVAAFRALNPAFTLRADQISPVALALLNARNPATGGYVVPSSTRPAGRSDPRAVVPGFGAIGGDPLAELRQVVPAGFRQLQGSARSDIVIGAGSRLQIGLFAADFPSLDPFPDPSSLTSPFTLRRSNRGRVVSAAHTHAFAGGSVNVARAGVFTLRNSRRLDDPFLGLTNDTIGVTNPALLFDDRDATRRLGHYVSRGATWSFGGPNDAFNRREQTTIHLSNVFAWSKGRHTVRAGGDFKAHRIDTDLPEEQATEFEKFENWQQLLVGLATEADTQFGFTAKRFRARDVSWFVSDDWRLSEALTLNLGVRWDWFGWPVERDGFLGNFDPARVTDPDNPLAGFVVPASVGATGVPQIDNAVAAASRTTTRHTLAGQDLNNVAPRLGFAYAPGGRWVLRGGYGLFYDRPSAAFINTVFGNYPFLREIEITVPARGVPIADAFATQLPGGRAVDFHRYFPFRLTFASGSYVVRDGTGIGGTGNIAETLEFRAIDRRLETPFYEHWNVGYELQVARETAVEVRYAGSRGHRLLLATALNQPWDLNDPAVPRHILDRITAAYRAGGGGPNAQDPDALGYGYVNPATGRPDRNFGPGGRLIPSEARGFYLGLNDAEAIVLQSRGRSIYHALQATVTRRMSRGLELHAAYTWSRSKDLFSSDPGSTAGSGRPDEPNTGFAVEHDSRDLEANWAVSDFDRPHRLSASVIWTPPWEGHALASGWQVAAYVQVQSGRPFSLYAPESDPLMRLAFQRVDLAPGATLDDVRRRGADPVEAWFTTAAVQRAFGPGSTPRNFLRGPRQRRVDLSVARTLRLGDRVRAELRWEIFNVFNTVNLGLPENNIDSVDFGRITRTIGGPRVSQVGVRVTF